MQLTKPMNFADLLSAASGDLRFDVDFERRPGAGGVLFMNSAGCPGPLFVPLDHPSHDWRGFIEYGDAIPPSDFRNLLSFRVWADFDASDLHLIRLLDAIEETGGSADHFVKREKPFGYEPADLWIYRGQIAPDRLCVEPMSIAAHEAWEIAFRTACMAMSETVEVS